MRYGPAEYISIALGGALLAIVGAIGYQAWKKSRIPLEELERQRRAALESAGKLGYATLLEYHDGHLFYTYAVRGVEYTASQDVSSLTNKLPADLSTAGPVAVKYDPKNPANSIVVSEQWSGLR